KACGLTGNISGEPSGNCSGNSPDSSPDGQAVARAGARCRVIHVRIAGTRMIDTRRHVPTPIVSTRPRLYSPRWAAIIMLPKPTIVVVELTKIALMTLAEGL